MRGRWRETAGGRFSPRCLPREWRGSWGGGVIKAPLHCFTAIRCSFLLRHQFRCEAEAKGGCFSLINLLLREDTQQRAQISRWTRGGGAMGPAPASASASEPGPSRWLRRRHAAPVPSGQMFGHLQCEHDCIPDCFEPPSCFTGCFQTTNLPNIICMSCTGATATLSNLLAEPNFLFSFFLLLY